jgi:hypothetical protein
MESVEALNQRLIEHFGRDIASERPIWRIVRAGEQFEKRFGEFEDHTKEGFFIRRVTEVRTVPKYQHIESGAWILEQLVQVPPHQIMELAGEKTSYEVKFVYQSFKTGELLPPIWSVTKITIEAILLAMNHPNPFAKYKDKSPEELEKEYAEMMDYLYGDRSDVSDALAYKEGVVVPHNYEVN